MKTDPAAVRLRQILRRCFELTRDEAQGKSPARPVIKGRLTEVERAAGACVTATEVYRKTAEEWKAQTGLCPVEGTALTACRCGDDMVWRGGEPVKPGEVITVWTLDGALEVAPGVVVPA